MTRGIALLVLASGVALAQTTPATFDVVSVKRNVSGDRSGGYSFQPGVG
jgi:hypothetical protein